MVWDAIKAHLRGLIIRQISHIKTTTKERETFVASEVQRVEGSYIADPTPSTECGWVVVALNAAENKCFLLQQLYFEEGEIQSSPSSSSYVPLTTGTIPHRHYTEPYGGQFTPLR